jgi:DNA sulfur modification protein DndC
VKLEAFRAQIERDILDQYLGDPNPRPWIVAFSGGKDSTLLLHLLWNALTNVPAKQRVRPVHVVCNNTLVENPRILQYVKTQLGLIRAAATRDSMPIVVEHTIPSLNDSFWVNMIGRGYPAPNSKFRWCTDRLKIKPTSKYILDTISKYGEVVILLGTRKAESETRMRSIERHEVQGERLSRHALPGAYVYAPIKEVSTNDLWWYLAQNDSPWGSDHTELVHIYRQASDNNDCPLITDTSTPTCGGSRFGCWVCTLVKNDRSMGGLIQSGETWMRPLLEIRDLLMATIDRKDPEYKPELYRMPVRRNFSKGIGPYWPRWRAQVLERLLAAEVEIQKTKPDIQLVTQQELVAIQTLWQRDFIYEYDVRDIYRKARGPQADIQHLDAGSSREQSVLREVCGKNESDYTLITSLLKAQRNRIIMVNSRGLQRDVDKILDEYLRPTFTDVYNQDRD